MTNEQISAMEEIKRIFKKYKTGPGEKCFITQSNRGKIKEQDQEKIEELLPLLDTGISKELNDYIELNYFGSVWGGPDLIEIDENGNRSPRQY